MHLTATTHYPPNNKIQQNSGHTALLTMEPGTMEQENTTTEEKKEVVSEQLK